jgi:uncharacterized phage protein (TIGR01671 family)
MKKLFKAWDKTNNEWYMEGRIFDLDYSASYGDFYFDNDHPHDMNLVQLEWVQFTGLKDRNEKEIFEKDILKFLWNGYWETQVVKYIENAFWCESDTGEHHMACKEYREVIGNIYENPELLEDKK